MAHHTEQLSKVPDLVLLRISQFLDLPSVKSLRLTCKLLGQRCLMTQRFLRCIRRQSTKLTVSALDRLLELARHERLGPMVRELTILGTIYDAATLEFQAKWKVKEIGTMRTQMQRVDLSAEELHEVGEELKWLAARQQEADDLDPETVISRLSAALKRFGSLSSINLDLFVCQGRKSTPGSATRTVGWYRRFAQASNTFYIATSAIARSAVALGSFIVFQDTVTCSIPIADISRMLPYLKDQGLPTTARHVSTLTLNVSTRIRDGQQQGDLKSAENHPTLRGSLGQASPERHTEDRPEPDEPEDYAALADFVAGFHNLEALDLRLFTTTVNRTGLDQLFTKFASDVALPNLVSLALGGLSVTEVSLLRFLQNHPKLVDLALENIRMTEGTWSSVFDHLQVGMLDLQRLHLSTLWQSRLLQLEAIDSDTDWAKVEDNGKIGFPCFGGFMQHTRTIGRNELEAGLKFKSQPEGRQMGSPAVYNWHQRLKQLYGPP